MSKTNTPKNHSPIKSKQKQTDLFKNISKAYGGDLLKKRKYRTYGRPISTRHSMHFVLRSSQAKGTWSFRRHQKKIGLILSKFCTRFGVRLNSVANAGNHLHLHLQLTNRHSYKPFIRAICAAIMMAVTGCSRWKKIDLRRKFWDRRPFSRIITGLKAILNLQDYIQINQLESLGYTRGEARFLTAWDHYEPG